MKLIANPAGIHDPVLAFRDLKRISSGEGYRIHVDI